MSIASAPVTAFNRPLSYSVSVKSLLYSLRLFNVEQLTMLLIDFVLVAELRSLLIHTIVDKLYSRKQPHLFALPLRRFVEDN